MVQLYLKVVFLLTKVGAAADSCCFAVIHLHLNAYSAFTTLLGKQPAQCVYCMII